MRPGGEKQIPDILDVNLKGKKLFGKGGGETEENGTPGKKKRCRISIMGGRRRIE